MKQEPVKERAKSHQRFMAHRAELFVAIIIILLGLATGYAVYSGDGDNYANDLEGNIEDCRPPACRISTAR